MVDQGHRGALGEAIDSLTSSSSPSAAQAPRRADPLEDTMSVLGGALDRPQVVPSGHSEPLLPTVEATAAASSWMYWRVRLTGTWQSVIPGPMLVEADGAPAAVVPSGSGGTLVSGSDRRTRRLDRAVVQTVSPDAVAFAVDLPSNPHWWTLVRWSLRRQRNDAWLFIVLAVVSGLGALLLPATTAAVFNLAIPQGRTDLVAVLLIVFALASAAIAIVSYLRGFLLVRIRDRMDLILSHAVTARLLRLRAGFFRSRPVGEIASRAMADQQARQSVDDAVISLLISSVFGLSSIGFVFAAGASIGIVVSLAVFALLSWSVAVNWKKRSVLPALLERRSSTDAMMLSILQTLGTWRVTAREDRALAEWALLQGASTNVMRRQLRSVSLSAPISGAASTAVLAAFVSAVVVLPVAALAPGSATAPGAFLAIYAAVSQVTIAMMALSGNLITLSEYGPQLSRLNPIVAAETENRPGAVHPGRVVGGLSMREVTFGYRRDRPPLFEDLSLNVEPGEFVAVVGPSGSGKSTMLRLLLGFEEPWSGTVNYDGNELPRLDIAAIRRQIGVVLQSSQPLGTTIRECICGPRTMTDDDLVRLATTCGLHQDLANMPLGLETPVGEGGSSLSGGQRQRLMIAAALAADPAVIFLDEATSALDNATQTVVMRAITESTATRVVIAHRLSTVERADRVLVVADGGIAESGSPAELLSAGGLFTRLAARQQL
ncbi:N/A [soil metagenome]